MYLNEQGIEFWYNTPDAPAVSGNIIAESIEPEINIAVKYINSVSVVRVIYIVNNRDEQHVDAKLLKHDTNDIRYYNAILPKFNKGDSVKYTVVCYFDGKQVPENNEIWKSTTYLDIQRDRLEDNEVEFSADVFKNTGSSLTNEFRVGGDGPGPGPDRERPDIFIIGNPSINSNGPQNGAYVTVSIEGSYGLGSGGLQIHDEFITVNIPNGDNGLAIITKNTENENIRGKFTYTGNVYTSGNIKVTATMYGKGLVSPNIIKSADTSEWVEVKSITHANIDIKLLENGNIIDDVNNIPVDSMHGKNITVQVTVDSPTLSVELKTSLDNYTNTILLKRDQIHQPWQCTLSIPGSQAPRTINLQIKDTDYLSGSRLTNYSFKIIDKTGPIIKVDYPNGQVFQSLQLINVTGSISDNQSGYQPGTLTYTFVNDRDIHIEPNIDSIFSFYINVIDYGPHTVEIKASDNSGNLTRIDWQFEVVLFYKPKTIEELLQPGNYLNDLLRFTGSHIQDNQSHQIVTTILKEKFLFNYGKIAEIDSPVGSRIVNDLLFPVTLLRKRNFPPLQTPELGQANVAGLIAHFSFQKQNDLILKNHGSYSLNGELLDGATWGDTNTEFEGALILDGTGYAKVNHHPSLGLGINNSDFSVCLWLYITENWNNIAWRNVIYKGYQNSWPDDLNHTFGIWLHPDNNKVHYRITTDINRAISMDSEANIQLNQWVHLVYVKRGQKLQLFLDGVLDSEIDIQGNVEANTNDLLIGKTDDPNNISIKGAISDLLIYGYALTSEDIQRLSLQRNIVTPSESPFMAYWRTTYEAILVGLGTSYEELRILPEKRSSQRIALAKRLGLITPDGLDDYLDVLLNPYNLNQASLALVEEIIIKLPLPIPTPIPVVSADDILEGWLITTFGIPSTSDLEPFYSDRTPIILQLRQQYLMNLWVQEDNSGAHLYLDPDLLEIDDLSSNYFSVITLLSSRTTQLNNQWKIFYDSVRNNIDDALRRAKFTDNEIQSLSVLEAKDAKGESITNDLKQLGLSFVAFRRIRQYQKLTSPMSIREQEDVAHLLTQFWKVRDRYPVWLNEERLLPASLWPNGLSNGAFVSGHYKRDFLPWRGTVAGRTEFEQRVAGRLRDWQSLIDSHERAILDAQRAALPVFRDRLLGISDLSSAADRMDQLTERLLVDVAKTGATTLTLIDQATLSLQSLVDGIRNNRFEAGHPASTWQLKKIWGEPNKPDNDPNLVKFDEEWQWMSSYGTWRSALMTYLYPENALFPELYVNTNPVYIEYIKIIKNDDFNQDKAVALYNQFNGTHLEYYIVLSAIALKFERDGLYTVALDWYRKLYDSKNTADTRAIAQILKDEHNRQNTPPSPVRGDRWTLDTDPHTNAERTKSDGSKCWPNPYTRYTLAHILKCMVALADNEFANGTLDSRERALSLYLEAKQILAFDELKDLQPTEGGQVYLPNPTFAALRSHITASLRKLRAGLSYLGTPNFVDPTRDNTMGAAIVSPSVRVTPYHFKVVIERAKQLTAQAQNLESQFLSAIEKRDVEDEKIRREIASLVIANETVSLRQLQKKEADDGVTLAQEQKTRNQLQKDRYSDWLATGQNEYEKSQIDFMWKARDAKYIATIAEGVIGAAQAVPTFIDIFASAGAKAVASVATVAAYATKTIALNFAESFETNVQVNGILASQERRNDEWRLQRDLANQDTVIADRQITLAQDRVAIATQENRIAQIQRDQTQDMVRFLATKFTNVEFYQWLIGELNEIYAYFLRVATATARQAEGQLAFERQQPMANLIKLDYWSFVTNKGNPANNNTIDRRGITASARLSQDLTTLEQHAFNTERRLLNLNQTLSLSRLFPLEFEEFRRIGLLSFATTLRMFDEGFPGHYMRLIKKVRISIAALIPPNQGIRATLSTGGLSRVVTGEMTYPTVVIRQDPQSVALTSPTATTGVFELDMQSELLYPFEGMGVDATWFLELPRAANPFNFDTLFDVVMTIEYTALHSQELRDRVIKQLPRQFSGDQSFSVRRDFPDTWYDLANPTAGPLQITIPLGSRNFPPNLSEVIIQEFAIVLRMNDGSTIEFSVKPSYTTPKNATPPSLVLTADAAISVQGIVSSRQSGAQNWRRLLSPAGINYTANSNWQFLLMDNADQSLAKALRDGLVDDILIVFTFNGMMPVWI